MAEKKDSFYQRWKDRARALKNESYALFLAVRDARTPWYAKLFCGIVVAYAFSPIDLVPDFIPILGYLDDLILVPLGISIAVKMIPVDVLQECRLQAQEDLVAGKPVNYVAGFFIILIWIGILYWLVRKIL
jgi:uncharacterized membrane protein YkvA (DUF1232 family)